MKEVEQDRTQKGLMSYLNDIPMLINSKCTATTVAEFLTFGNLTRTMATRAAYYVN